MTPVTNSNDDDDAGDFSERLRMRYLPPPAALASIQSPHALHPAHTPGDRYLEMIRSGPRLGLGLCQDQSSQRQDSSQVQNTVDPLFVRDGPEGYRRDHHSIGYASATANDERIQSILPRGVAQHTPPLTVHDLDRPEHGSRPGEQPMITTPAGFVKPRPIHPSSPMQLDFILDSPKPLYPVLPALSCSQYNNSYSPSRSLPQRPGLVSSTAPAAPNSSQQVDDTDEHNDNGSSPVPSTQVTATASSSSSDTTQLQQPGSIPETQTRFEAVTAHTAKCDLCNSRNDTGMSRCLLCGWQSCHSCTLKNGCTRTHKAGSRVHTGPVDSSQLVSAGESSRGKKKSRGRGRGKGRGRGRSGSRVVQQSRPRMGDDNDGAGVRAAVGSGSPRRYTRQESMNARGGQSHVRAGEGERNIDASSSTGTAGLSPPPPSAFSPSSSPPINEQPFSPTSTDSPCKTRDTTLEGAKNLFAFSLEAHMIWTYERWENNRDQTSDAGEWEPFMDIEDIHAYAQEEATRVFFK